MEKEVPKIRVVKKTTYGREGEPLSEWYEVQYQTWRTYTQFGSPKNFKDKDKAVKWALRKKAGATSNSTVTEVIA